MKKNILIFLGLMTFIAAMTLTGCSDSDNIAGPTSNDSEVTIGLVHTEVLDQIYADLDLAKAAKGQLDRSSKDTIVIGAVNKITDRYGVERMDPEEILNSVQRGRDMAQQDPVQLVSSLLSPAEQEWWDRFSIEAEVGNARLVYQQHCQLYGTPDYESTLGQLLDVGLSSAEFWGKYRGDQQPIYRNPYVPNQQKSWKNFLRFCVTVVVDGACGAAAAGGGTAVGGPVGGAVAAGVVGGLASHGADDIIFG